MIAKKIKTAEIAKLDAANYMKRAQELLESMRNNLAIDNLNAGVIDGVHAAISACDTLTVALGGKRSISSKHTDSVELLKQVLPPSVKADLNRLSRIIGVKSHIEYGPSLVTSKDAQKLTQDVERFFEWAENFYKKIRG